MTLEEIAAIRKKKGSGMSLDDIRAIRAKSALPASPITVSQPSTLPTSPITVSQPSTLPTSPITVSQPPTLPKPLAPFQFTPEQQSNLNAANAAFGFSPAVKQPSTPPKLPALPKFSEPSGITSSAHPLVKSFAYGAELVGQGLLGAGEGITDYFTAQGNNLMGKIASFGGIAPNPVSNYFEDTARYSLQDDLAGRYGESIERRYRPNDAQRTLGKVNESGATMLPAMAASVVSPSLGKLVLGAQAGGRAAAQALREGATLDRALTYGTTSGLAESTIESIAGGVPGLPEGVATSVVNRLLHSPIAGKVVDILGEGGEEALSTIIDPYIKRAIYDGNARNATAEEIAGAAAMGVVMSGLMQAGTGAGTLMDKASGAVKTKTQNFMQNVNAEIRAIGEINPAPALDATDHLVELSDGTLHAKGQADFYGGGRGISSDPVLAGKLPMRTVSPLPALPSPTRDTRRVGMIGETVTGSQSINPNAPYDEMNTDIAYRLTDYLKQIENLKTPQEIETYRRGNNNMLKDLETVRARTAEEYADYIYHYKGNGVALVPFGESGQRLRVSQNEPWYSKYAGRKLSRAQAHTLAEQVVNTPAMQADFPAVSQDIGFVNRTAEMVEDLRYLRDNVLTDGLLNVAQDARGFTASYGTPARPMQSGTEFVTPINAVMGGRPATLPENGLDAAGQTVHNMGGGGQNGNDTGGARESANQDDGGFFGWQSGYGAGAAQEIRARSFREIQEPAGTFLKRTGQFGKNIEVDDKGNYYAFREASEPSENAAQVKKLLDSRGITAFVCEEFEHNTNGLTTQHLTDALTISDGRVAISNQCTLPATEIAGHEGFHAIEILAPDSVKPYADIISNPRSLEKLNNLKSATDYMGDLLYEEAYDSENSKQRKKILQELGAQIGGKMDSDAEYARDLFTGILDDFDATYALWKKVNSDFDAQNSSASSGGYGGNTVSAAQSGDGTPSTAYTPAQLKQHYANAEAASQNMERGAKRLKLSDLEL